MLATPVAANLRSISGRSLPRNARATTIARLLVGPPSMSLGSPLTAVVRARGAGG